MSSVGGNTSNAGRMIISLKPFDERTKQASEIVKDLRPELSKIPGMNTFLQVPPSIRIGGQNTKSLYQVTLMSPDSKILNLATSALAEKMKELPGLEDITTDVLSDMPQIDIHVNRDLAATIGITQDQVEQTLASAYGQRQISTIYAPSNQYRVVIGLAPKYQRGP